MQAMTWDHVQSVRTSKNRRLERWKLKVPCLVGMMEEVLPAAQSLAMI